MPLNRETHARVLARRADLEALRKKLGGEGLVFDNDAQLLREVFRRFLREEGERDAIRVGSGGGLEGKEADGDDWEEAWKKEDLDIDYLLSRMSSMEESLSYLIEEEEKRKDRAARSKQSSEERKRRREEKVDSKVVFFLQEHRIECGSFGLSAKEIAKEVRMKESEVRQSLNRLVMSDLVRRMEGRPILFEIMV